MLDAENRRSPEELKKAAVRRATAAVLAGHVKRAVEILYNVCTEEMTDPEAAFTALQALHPGPEPSPLNPPTKAEHESITTINHDEVRKAAKMMARGEAPGASGLASDVLWQALEEEERQNSVVLLDRITELVRQILSGRSLPAIEREALLAIRLVAIPKRKGGIRPVAMSEVILKLAARVALERTNGYGANWDFQYGLRKGGAELAVHRTRDLLRKGKRIVALDASNAYNSLHRSAFFDHLRVNDDPALDTLRAYAALVYGGSSVAYWDDGGNIRNITVQRGVRQGDPAAPLLFCMALQPVLARVAATANVETIAYLDDVTICGDSNDVDRAVRFMVDEASKIGLTLGIEQDSENCQPGKAPMLRILGAAVCTTPEDTARFLEHIRPLEDYDRFLEAIALLPEPLRLRLLRQCGISKAGFVARCHGTESASWLEKFDERSLDCACTLLPNLKKDELRRFSKLYLPFKFGGLGLTKWAPIARICSAASRTQQDQDRPLADYYMKTYHAERISDAARKSRSWVEGLVSLQPHHYKEMLQQFLGIPLIPQEFYDVKMRCSNPHHPKVYTAKEYVQTHVPQCASNPGLGNPSARHAEAVRAITDVLRRCGQTVTTEFPCSTLLKKPASDQNLRMDIAVNGKQWIDVTVTTCEERRFHDKEKLYGQSAKDHGVTFNALAFDMEGRILPKSMPFAKRLASGVGLSVTKFFAPASACIALYSTMARKKAAMELYAILSTNRVVLSETLSLPPPPTSEPQTIDQPTSTFSLPNNATNAEEAMKELSAGINIPSEDLMIEDDDEIAEYDPVEEYDPDEEEEDEDDDDEAVAETETRSNKVSEEKSAAGGVVAGTSEE